MGLIDADKIADYVCDKCGEDNCDRNPTHCIERDFTMACAKEMPEAVVRCKDCKFFEDEDGDCWCYCHNDTTCRDGYCSWGERREDGKND